ncbi:MAG: hypothetical protein AAGG46_07095, partial [Planctomycetota bacterium]
DERVPTSGVPLRDEDHDRRSLRLLDLDADFDPDVDFDEVRLCSSQLVISMAVITPSRFRSRFLRSPELAGHSSRSTCPLPLRSYRLIQLRA